MNDKKKKLYDNLIADGYKLGTYAQFEAAMGDASSRSKLYNNLTADGYNLGGLSDFESVVASPSAPTARKTPASASSPSAPSAHPTATPSNGKSAEGLVGAQRTVAPAPRSTNPAAQKAASRTWGPGSVAEFPDESMGVPKLDVVTTPPSTLEPEERLANEYEHATARRTEILKRMRDFAKDARSSNPIKKGMNLPQSKFAKPITYDDDYLNIQLPPGYEKHHEWQSLVAALNSTEEEINRIGELAAEDEEKSSPDYIKKEDIGWGNFVKAAAQRAPRLLRGFTDGHITDLFMSDKERVAAKGMKNLSDKIDSREDLSDNELYSATGIVDAEENREEQEDAISQWYRAGTVGRESVPFMIEFMLTPGGKYKGVEKAVAGVTGKFVAEDVIKTGFREGLKRYGAKAITERAKNWAIKATGETVKDLSQASKTSALFQTGDIEADANRRMAGQLGAAVDENGNAVTDENGNPVLAAYGREAAGSAMYKAVASSIIENYTERLGEHMRFLPKSWASKPFVSGVSRAGRVVGVNGLPQEIAEEEAGVLLNEVFGVEDSIPFTAFATPASERSEEQQRAVDSFWQNQLDIVTGITASVGGTSVISSPFAAHHAYSYYAAKHNVDRMGATARYALDGAGRTSYELGGDGGVEWRDEESRWAPLQEQIDGTTNDGIRDLAQNIIESEEYTPQEKVHILNYIKAQQAWRAYNIGTMQKESTPEQQAEDEAFMAGHEAAPEERTAIRDRYDVASQKMRAAFNLGDDVDVEEWLERTYPDISTVGDYLEAMAINDESLDGNVRDAILEYFEARGVMNGMEARMGEDVDMALLDNDMWVNGVAYQRFDGAVVNAVASDGSEVYVVNGPLGMRDENGTLTKDFEEWRIDTPYEAFGDASYIVRDANTGKLRQVPGSELQGTMRLSVADELREQRAQQIRDAFEQEKSRQVDGVPDFNVGDTYYLVDENGNPHTAKVTSAVVDNGDGTTSEQPMVSINGMPAIPLTDDVKQFISNDMRRKRQLDMLNEQSATETEAPAVVETAEPWNDEASAKPEEPAAVNGSEAAASPAVETREDVMATEPGDYELDDEVEAMSDSRKKVKGHVTYIDDLSGEVEVEWEGGNTVGGDDVGRYTPEQLRDMLAETKPTRAEVEAAAPAAETPAEEAAPAVTVAAAETPAITEAAVGEAPVVEAAAEEDNDEASEMPTKDDGTPDYVTAGVDRTVAEIDNDEGLDDDERQAFIKSNISGITSDIAKHDKKKPTMGRNVAEYKRKKAEWQQKRDAMEAELDFWNAVDRKRADNRREQDVYDTENRSAREIVAQLGEPRDLEEAVVMAMPGYKYIWGNSSTSSTKGVGAHIGSNSESERRNRVAWSGRQDKGALYPEQVAEKIYESLPETAGTSYDDVFNIVLETLRNYHSPRAAVEALAKNRSDAAARNRDAEEDHYAALHEEEARNAGFDNVDEYDAWRSGVDAEGLDAVLAGRAADEANTLFEAEESGFDANANDSIRGALASEETDAMREAEESGFNAEAEDAVRSAIAAAEAETATAPTDAQKEAGNYKKGHVKIDGYNLTIENPKGSTRSGKDADGKPWSVTMNNTYGYIRGTEGVDGDHIDVFLSDNPTSGNVYVVDQVNADGTFDEHKVMYGFNSAEEAREAYLANYSEGWQGLGNITEVSKDEFKKWIGSSHRKTKPFAEYKSVKAMGAQKEGGLDLNGETYSEEDLESMVSDNVNAAIEDSGLDAKIVGVKVIGSRTRGEEREDSDLDVLVEYEGRAHEDVMFNAINDYLAENGLDNINGVHIDVNPITRGKSGTIEQFMKRNEGFTKEDSSVEVKVLSDEEAEALIAAMKANAEIQPELEFSEENWASVFGDNDTISTPIGEVKMGENQKTKLQVRERTSQFGMVVETLRNPDIVLEEADKEGDNLFHERPSSYLFVKTFKKADGTKYVHFESVTISKDGMEISISSHIIRENQLKNKLKSDRLLYKATALDAPANTSAEQSIEGGSLSSERKGTEESGNKQEISEKSADGAAKKPTRAEKAKAAQKAAQDGQLDLFATADAIDAAMRDEEITSKSPKTEEEEGDGGSYTPSPDKYGVKEGDKFLTKKGEVITLNRYDRNPNGTHSGVYSVRKDGKALSNGGVKDTEIQANLASGKWTPYNADDTATAKPAAKWELRHNSDTGEITMQRYTENPDGTRTYNARGKQTFKNAEEALAVLRNPANNMQSVLDEYEKMLTNIAEYDALQAERAAEAAKPVTPEKGESPIDFADRVAANEREKQAATEPMMTAEDIAKSKMPQFLKDNALDYINGKRDSVTENAYNVIAAERRAEKKKPAKRKTKSETTKKSPESKKTTEKSQKNAEKSVTSPREASKPQTTEERRAALREKLLRQKEEFKNIGKGRLSSLPVDIALEKAVKMAEIMATSAEIGYTYLLDGVTKVKEWSARMKEDFGDIFKDTFDYETDAEVDKYISDLWNASYTDEESGEKRSLAEWADVLAEPADGVGTAADETVRPQRTDKKEQEAFKGIVKDALVHAAITDNAERPFKSILQLRNAAEKAGMTVDSQGRDDILLQELVEDALVSAAREVVGRFDNPKSDEAFKAIVRLYEMQPTIAQRSSNRIKMQQYSTPLPMGFVADWFAYRGGNVLEPTAGNGMLVFGVPANAAHANELDATRLDNLRGQGFMKVTDQDATKPFPEQRKYDAVIANPPFGHAPAKMYDGKSIRGLEEQILLNALEAMKDNGRAAIIIGGNMDYAKNGAVSGNKAFWTYLYDHYNVKGVVDMDGSLYQRQGTTYPTRMILIDGRRTEDERAETRVYPPVKDKAVRKATSFDDLFEIVKELRRTNNKTNGNEVLRSGSGQPVLDLFGESWNGNEGADRAESPKNGGTTARTGRNGSADTETASRTGDKPVREERSGNSSNGTGGRKADSAAGSRSSDGNARNDANQRLADIRSTPSDRVKIAPKKEFTEEEASRLTSEKLPYRRHSKAFSLQSVAPAYMVEAMDKQLKIIENEYGDIDEFVQTELGYDTVEDLHNALAAEQVDSVAMAIYQMKNGKAFIVGDQTGVGKGRQMAALIRWATKQGSKPVFFTQKADLFTDIYRDLLDVGSGDLKPFIVNADGAMLDVNGNAVHKPLSSAQQKKVFESGEIPEGYDFVVVTYSQVNTGDAISAKEANDAKKAAGERGDNKKVQKMAGKATPKATWIRQITEGNYLFMDESHTGAGQSNTGYYMQSISKTAKAVTFASATFAKRPDTMPLYAFRTAMSEANVEVSELIGIIEKGGVTLQEIMSRALTEAGQMVRRERDMSDVITDWTTIDDTETVREARENYDKTIEVFNAIVDFQKMYVKPLIDAIDQDLAAVAESLDIKRGTKALGIENTPFASKTYNYTKQLMLALKAKAVADKVAEEIEAGRHPVIALESTMESSLADYNFDEEIDEPTFSASMLRGLDSSMKYTKTDENGKEMHGQFSPKELGEEGERAYYELRDRIVEATKGVFISPLDAIITELKNRGYSVGELTGRSKVVEVMPDGKVFVRKRTDKDKKKLQRDFNSGATDVLILNKSASTGISLHASSKFTDQRQRTMIIAQPLSDINDYMQMIGRIDRTGQVTRGYYINLGLPVPAESRFLMMLSTKLKSLNANTTSAQDSESNDVEAPDLLNKYGSQVVVEYLRDHKDIYEKLGEPLKGSDGNVSAAELDDYKASEDDARKITGYVALLSTKEQEDFYNDVVQRYTELIQYLNDTGENDLKITTMPLRAKTLSRKISSEGKDPNGTNPFAQDAYVEEVEMDVLRKPMKADEVRKVIEKVNNGEDPQKRTQNLLHRLHEMRDANLLMENKRAIINKQVMEERIQRETEKINARKKMSDEDKKRAIADFIEKQNANEEERHNKAVQRVKETSRGFVEDVERFTVGETYMVPDPIDSAVYDHASPAIFCGFKFKEERPTPSTTLAVFAVLDGRRRIDVKLSTLVPSSIERATNDNYDTAKSTDLENWDSQVPSESRTKGHIMTGNILQAVSDTYDKNTGTYPGQLISYTDIDGNVHDGILMPQKWDTSRLKNSGTPINKIADKVKALTHWSDPIETTDGDVTIYGGWRGIEISVPKSTKRGGKYFKDNKILRLVERGEFYPSKGALRADVTPENIDKVLKVLADLGVRVQSEKTADDGVLYRDDEEDDMSVRAQMERAMAGLKSHGPVFVVSSLEDLETNYGWMKARRKSEYNDLVDYFNDPDGPVALYMHKVGDIIVFNRTDGEIVGLHSTIIHEQVHSAVEKGIISTQELVDFYTSGNPLVMAADKQVRSEGYEDLKIPEETLTHVVEFLTFDYVTSSRKGIEICETLQSDPKVANVIQKIQDFIYEDETRADKFWHRAVNARRRGDVSERVHAGNDEAAQDGFGSRTQNRESLPGGEKPLFRIADEEEARELEKEPTMRVYRAMQLVENEDGTKMLVPPMAGKIEGKWQTGIKLDADGNILPGQWEVSDERPDLAKYKIAGKTGKTDLVPQDDPNITVDEKGQYWYKDKKLSMDKETGKPALYFWLDKGNKKGVPARYNPYWHTSYTPLNDQFSEAQSRSNLVTVEVEVPISELTSGYKATGAKDSVGKIEWKAGIIQGQISGTRTVVLSRYDKPARIVSDAEVAKTIVGMFGDAKVTMPSNVVTPSLRAELEKLGVPFVETNNRGMLTSGEHKGKSYSSVYAIDAAKLREAEQAFLDARDSGKWKRGKGHPTLDHLARHLNMWTDAFGDRVKFEVHRDGSAFTGRKAKAKGWFDPKTGKVHIILDNHHSDTDLQRTIFHEVAAHLGLRKMLGKDFYTFLNNIYENAERRIKDEIDRLAREKYNGNRVTATEEYMAKIAERMAGDVYIGEVSLRFWDKMLQFAKKKLMELLRKIGVKLNFELTDEDIAYVLWESYNNVLRDKSGNNVFDTAEDIDMQQRLGVRNFENADELEERLRKLRRRTRYMDHSLTAEEETEYDGDITKSENFKNWFGNWENNPENASKVVDEDGKPLVVHHATDSSFTIFDKEKLGENTDFNASSEDMAKTAHLGFWFNTDNPSNTTLQSLTMDVFLDIKRPLEFESLEDLQDELSNYETGEEYAYMLKAKGYDGVVVKNDEEFGGASYVAFDSSQIKSATDNNGDFDPDNDDIRFRDGEAYDEYERKMPNKQDDFMQKLGYRFQEAWQDSMLSLKVLQDAIVKESGKPLQDFEDAYRAENRMSSMNSSAAEVYAREYFRPMIDAVAALINEGVEYDDVVKYAMAKHGLERNRVMLEREVDKKVAENKEKLDAAIERKVMAYSASVVADYDADDLSDDAVKAEIAEKVNNFKEEQYKKYRDEQTAKAKRDFSGLSSLFEYDDYEKAAQDYVDAFENEHDTTDLWDKINAATKNQVDRAYAAGLIDKQTRDMIKGMYDYYIPLRGFDETTAEDMYQYMTSETSPYNTPIKTAKGRKSVADDPFATIGNMAESGIMQANRNRMKQHLYRAALNHKTSLLTVGQQWYAIDTVTGQWVPAFPEVNDDMTPAEYKQAIDEFNEKMRDLESRDLATQNPPKADVRYRAFDKQKMEHTIIVKVNGQDYNIYVNGNPRAAQAVNGQLNPDTTTKEGVFKWGKEINNWMARNFTSRNPAFVLTNLSRDVIFSGTAVMAKENARYFAQYSKNISSAFAKATLPKLIYKWNHGTLDMNNEVEKYFYEFMMMGGETGYTRLNTVEDYKKKIDKQLRELQKGKNLPRKAWDGLWDSVEFLNRSAEDTTRFMVYMTSRQMGRSRERATWDAKEITVNFNKKGSGALGAKWVNLLYVFSNAAIQGLTNFGRLIKQRKGKMAAALGTFTAAGMLAPALAVMMQALFPGGDGDDELSYWDIPEWTRRNNLVFYIPFTGNKFITIPLPHELRPFYGLGEMSFSAYQGKKKWSEVPGEAAASFAALLPLDFTGNGGNLAVAMTPTYAQPIAQIAANKDYFGKPIYKDTPYNKNMPEWTKAYRGTNGLLVDATRWLNRITGGNDVKSGWLDLNPAVIEHLFESYFGGTGQTINQLGKTVSMAWNEDAREVRNVPVVNKFLQSAEERTTNSGISNLYYKYLDEAKETKRLIDEYGKRLDDPEYAAYRTELVNSPEFVRYSIMEEYKKPMELLREAANSAESQSQVRAYKKRIAEMQREIVARLEEARDGVGKSERNRVAFKMAQYQDIKKRMQKEETAYNKAVKDGSWTPQMQEEEIKRQQSPDYTIYGLYKSYESVMRKYKEAYGEDSEEYKKAEAEYKPYYFKLMQDAEKKR